MAVSIITIIDTQFKNWKEKQSESINKKIALLHFPYDIMICSRILFLFQYLNILFRVLIYFLKINRFFLHCDGIFCAPQFPFSFIDIAC